MLCGGFAATGSSFRLKERLIWSTVFASFDTFTGRTANGSMPKSAGC